MILDTLAEAFQGEYDERIAHSLCLTGKRGPETTLLKQKTTIKYRSSLPFWKQHIKQCEQTWLRSNKVDKREAQFSAFVS